jgi:hypothetical protein
MRNKLFALLCGLILAASSIRAQPSLEFALQPASQPGIGSNAVFFVATLINPSLSSNLFLNNIQFAFFGVATNYLGPGTNAFFANVPGILRPGEAYDDIALAVSINPATPPGDYFASVTIQGGAEIFASSNLASQILLITSADTVSDGIPDWWRQQYFGGDGTTTNAQSCATCDADATGQNNLFKYVAGLVPTNPASVFVLSISNSANLPIQPNVSFGPVAQGRSYTLQSETDLLVGGWSPLGGAIVQQTNGRSITIADSLAFQTQKFYRVQIALP